MAPVMHPYPGRGRWTVAAILVAGPALQAVEFLVGTNPRADAAARVAFWSENQGTVGVAITAGFLAVPFLLGGFAAMVAFSVRDSQRLAWAAAALLTFAMAGLAAVQGSLVAVYGLVLAGDEARGGASARRRQHRYAGDRHVRGVPHRRLAWRPHSRGCTVAFTIRAACGPGPPCRVLRA